MTSPSPAVLPVATVQSQSSVAASSAPIAATTPAFRSFINGITDTVRNGLAQRRPWAELADRNAFSRPESFSDAAVRVRKNYTYFRVNYLALLAAVVAFSLVSHPFSLILLAALLASWLFLYVFRPSDPPLILLGRQFSDRETLAILIVATVVVVFLTSVGSVLISALLGGAAVVCAHGSFREPEDMFLDDQEPNPTTGFLSFLGRPASNAPASGGPAVASRV